MCHVTGHSILDNPNMAGHDSCGSSKNPYTDMRVICSCSP